MRLVSKTELRQHPPGTIFQTYDPHDLGKPQVLSGAEGEQDYVCCDFGPYSNGAYIFEKSDPEMARWGLTENDEIVFYPAGFGRAEDYYEGETKRFLIWEDADRRRFAEWLLDPEKCADQMNDVAHALIVADK